MTAKALMALGLVTAVASSASAVDSFDGAWTSDPASCVGDSVWPLVVTQRSLSWPGGACLVATSYRVGDVWHVDARCWGEGAVASVPIRLQMKGERLVFSWARSRPEELYRCP